MSPRAVRVPHSKIINRRSQRFSTSKYPHNLPLSSRSELRNLSREVNQSSLGPTKKRAGYVDYDQRSLFFIQDLPIALTRTISSEHPSPKQAGNRGKPSLILSVLARSSASSRSCTLLTAIATVLTSYSSHCPMSSKYRLFPPCH